VITPLFDSHSELRGYTKVTRDMSDKRRLVHSSRHERVHRDARARAAKPARADPQCGDDHADAPRAAAPVPSTSSMKMA